MPNYLIKRTKQGYKLTLYASGVNVVYVSHMRDSIEECLELVSMLQLPLSDKHKRHLDNYLLYKKGA